MRKCVVSFSNNATCEKYPPTLHVSFVRTPFKFVKKKEFHQISIIIQHHDLMRAAYAPNFETNVSNLVFWLIYHLLQTTGKPEFSPNLAR